MLYQLAFQKDIFEGEIELPLSKSISNRLLMIRALSGSRQIDAAHLSDSDDTRVMAEGLTSDNEVIDIGHAGTSMRFLTAYFAATSRVKTVTGSERMKERPIRDLVDALNRLGADIRYLETTGYPPVRTSGRPLSGNTLHINGNISSQFITALLLIAPTLPDGLTIDVVGDLVSASYVKMTLGLMRQAGVKSFRNGRKITVAAQKYHPAGMNCERDWSAASYWYECAALSDRVSILLKGLTGDSLQGDAAVASAFERLGVETRYLPDGALLTKRTSQPTFFDFDFINAPDIAQTLAVCLCLKNIPFRFSGVRTLRVKETDRISALQNELLKLGFVLSAPHPDIIEWNGEKRPSQKEITIATYHDHRMAMAFAPAAMCFPNIRIENPEVVSKSYPNFWKDFARLGGHIVQC
ncbi:MAG: 3-phosphoshikimate 1-carboxyvinyltransferase [Bacteroidales bacterium]|jgi:3-phosphoshikimate 1-carboxyvinyltransferase|nr:3-phosphoshikimate 1-carboxyvinyltransferase [Bacteroidales bacterium]